MKALFFFPIILIVYLVVMRIIYGMTRSWSETYRKLSGWRVIFFTLALWLGAAAPIIILGLHASEGSKWQMLWFFAGAGILFVGAAPVYWNSQNNRNLSTENKVHIFGATVSVIFLCAAILLTLGGWLNYLLVALFLAFTFTQTAHNILKLENQVSGLVKTLLRPVFYFSTFFDKWKLPNNTYAIESAIGAVTFMAFVFH